VEVSVAVAVAVSVEVGVVEGVCVMVAVAVLVDVAVAVGVGVDGVSASQPVTSIALSISAVKAVWKAVWDENARGNLFGNKNHIRSILQKLAEIEAVSKQRSIHWTQRWSVLAAAFWQNCKKDYKAWGKCR
jgi:hypothetical protein